MEAPIALRFFNTQFKIEVATLAKFYLQSIFFNNEYNFMLSFCTYQIKKKIGKTLWKITWH